MDALSANRVKATFFVVGSQILKFPEILKRIANEGHEIGVHTWTHPDLNTLSNEQIISEALWTHQIIKDLTGHSSKLFRCPFGRCGERVLNVLTGMGFKVLYWSHDTRDWESKGASTKSEFEKWMKSGDSDGISLQHDLTQAMSDKARFAIEAIKGAGLTAVGVSTCIGIDSPYGPLIDPLALAPNSSVPINGTEIPSAATEIPSAATDLPSPTSDTSDSIANGGRSLMYLSAFLLLL